MSEPRHRPDPVEWMMIGTIVLVVILIVSHLAA